MPDIAALINVNVVPMDRECVLPEQTVIVKGDRIGEIGRADLVRLPRGASSIDGQGKYLMPGLIDLHVHLEGDYQLTLWIANGVTTVRNMWGTPAILETRKRIEGGEIPGPTVFTTGPILNNTGARCTPVHTRRRAWEVVAEHKALGYDFVKVYDDIPVDVYDALIDAARCHEIPLIGHVPIAVGIEHALASRHHCIEHLTGYDLFLQKADSPLSGKVGNPARFQVWRYVDEEKIGPIAEATRRAGTWNAVSLTVFWNKMSREEMERELSRPHMKYVPEWVRQAWFVKHGWVSRMSESIAQDVRAGTENRAKLIRAFLRAGAGIGLGTDDPDPLLASGFCVHQELQNLVGCGLTPYEAIQAGTQNAAHCLGVGDDLGTVAPGRRADLLLVEENPLTDVANAAKISGVMSRGRWSSKSELQAMLESLAQQRNGYGME